MEYRHTCGHPYLDRHWQRSRCKPHGEDFADRELDCRWQRKLRCDVSALTVNGFQERVGNVFSPGTTSVCTPKARMRASF